MRTLYVYLHTVRTLYVYLHNVRTLYVFLHTVRTLYIYLNNVRTLYVYLHTLRTLYVYLHTVRALYVFLHNVRTSYVYLHNVRTLYISTSSATATTPFPNSSYNNQHVLIYSRYISNQGMYALWIPCSNAWNMWLVTVVQTVTAHFSSGPLMHFGFQSWPWVNTHSLAKT